MKFYLLFSGIAAAVGCISILFSAFYRNKMEFAKSMVGICEQGLARRARDWQRLPEHQVLDIVDEGAVASDLNLFGFGSLMQLVCTAETIEGRSTLANWFLSCPTEQQVRQRQTQARVLAQEIGWRQGLQQRCEVIRKNQAAQVRNLKQWAGDNSYQPPFWLRRYAIALRFIVPAILVSFFFLPYVAFLVLFIVLVVIVFVNILLTIAYSGDLHSHLDSLAPRSLGPASRSLSRVFSYLGTSACLVNETTERCGEAAVGLSKLEKILIMQSISSDPLLAIFVGLPLQLLFMWDIQVWLAAVQWRHQYGARVALWFEQLGEVEALCSLASLSYEQPSWDFPEIQESCSPSFEAKDLGHPLLPDDKRVVNDCVVGPPGTLLMITGSNMGGKSTLLRAIGINAVLAHAGSPCCCSSLKMTPLHIMTSISISDSLDDSKSFFMAQLISLKRVVDHVRKIRNKSKNAAVMYLFDEVLNGTNSVDRRVAVEALVGFLLKRHAIGVMTTHDLEIATGSEHDQALKKYYLSHQIDGRSGDSLLKYDYKLRPGIAPNTNALVLFRLLGISGEQE